MRYLSISVTNVIIGAKSPPLIGVGCSMYAALMVVESWERVQTKIIPGVATMLSRLQCV